MSQPTIILGDGGNQIENAIQAMTGVSQTILQIQLPPNPAVPAAGDHLVSAKNIATTWLGQGRPQLSAALSAAFDNANAFLSQIYPQLSAIATGPSPSAPQWNALLTQVTQQTQASQASLQGASNDVNALRVSAVPVAQAFSSDVAAASAKVQADQGEIQQLQDQINSLQQKINDDRKYEDVGWILGPVGALISHELGDLIANVSGMQNQIRESMQTLQGDQAEIAALTALAQQLGGVTTSLNGLMAGCVAINSKVAVCTGTLNNLASETSIQPGPFAMAQLNTLRDNFLDLRGSLPGGDFGPNAGM